MSDTELKRYQREFLAKTKQKIQIERAIKLMITETVFIGIVN